ncbi:hypothetical protein GALL_133630 [mine drainage metagenome]|uniref:Transmembrane protein n=1 Tax=mine drainage metagenome TaxID=410659 RepID=A0A1J5SK85_9ZZZZ
MNRRLYFMLPDTDSAHTMFNELLLARVDANRIHFLANADVQLGDLPEATVSERTDLIEGWEMGMGLGTLVGFAAGLIAISIPTWWYTKPIPVIATLVICSLAGLLVGGLWTALIATTIPNSQLKPFEGLIAKGQVLMIVLAPFHRVQEIRRLLAEKHPEVTYNGTWPAEHVIFP